MKSRSFILRTVCQNLRHTVFIFAVLLIIVLFVAEPYFQDYGILPEPLLSTLNMFQVDGIIGLNLFKRFRLQFKDGYIFFPTTGNLVRRRYFGNVIQSLDIHILYINVGARGAISVLAFVIPYRSFAYGFNH